MPLVSVPPGAPVEVVDPFRVMCAPVQLLEWLGVAAVLTDLEGALLVRGSLALGSWQGELERQAKPA